MRRIRHNAAAGIDQHGSEYLATGKQHSRLRSKAIRRWKESCPWCEEKARPELPLRAVRPAKHRPACESAHEQRLRSAPLTSADKISKCRCRTCRSSSIASRQQSRSCGPRHRQQRVGHARQGADYDHWPLFQTAKHDVGCTFDRRAVLYRRPAKFHYDHARSLVLRSPIKCKTHQPFGRWVHLILSWKLL